MFLYVFLLLWQHRLYHVMAIKHVEFEIWIWERQMNLCQPWWLDTITPILYDAERCLLLGTSAPFEPGSHGVDWWDSGTARNNLYRAGRPVDPRWAPVCFTGGTSPRAKHAEIPPHLMGRAEGLGCQLRARPHFSAWLPETDPHWPAP